MPNPSDGPDAHALAAARVLTWLAWITALSFLGLWWRWSGGSVYDKSLWSVQKVGMAAPLVLVAVVGCASRMGRERGSRRLGLVIGALGLGMLWLLHLADALALGLVERMLFPPEGRICSFIPAVAPGLSYTGLGWLAVVLRMQAEAVGLLAQRGWLDRSWLRRRALGLVVGLLPVLVVAELALFVGAHNFHMNRMAHADPTLADLLCLCAPVLAMLVYELWIRREHRVVPVPPRTPGADTAGSRTLEVILDPVALRRGRVAERIARGVAALMMLAGLVALRRVGLETLLEPPESVAWLIAGLGAMAVALALLVAPRPLPWLQRATPDHELSPFLCATVERLVQLRARLERERAAALWTPAWELSNVLLCLTEPERKLLDRHHADVDALVHALRRLSPNVEPGLTEATCRRSLYVELTRFCARVRGARGVDPYRGDGRDFDDPTLAWLADERVELELPRWWITGAIAGGAAVLALLSRQPAWTVVIVTLVAGALAHALARGIARRMYALAWPPGRALDDPAHCYSPSFARALGRSSMIDQCARGLATTSALLVGLAIPLVCVRPGVVVGLWSLAQPSHYVLDLLTPALLGAVGLLALGPLRVRLRERLDLARLRRWQRAIPDPDRVALIRELMALRLAWSTRIDPGVALLGRIAELLRSTPTPTLAALQAKDRDALVERVEQAIVHGAARTRASRRALAVELETAERLLARVL